MNRLQRAINDNTSKKAYLAYCSSIFCIFVFLIWKCRYGFANRDEAFYLTVPYRLCRGDGLLIHEWHPSQMAGLLLAPAVKLHLLIWGGTEGILLNFRILFTIVWTTSALFYFIRLKRFSIVGAMIASISFLLYTPFGIMALSYNSMGILLLLNTGIILATAERCFALQDLIAGLFFAGAVLCCPQLVVLYAAFTGIILWREIYNIKKPALCQCSGCEELVRFPNFRQWLFFTLGCGLLFCVFCVHVLQHGSFQDLMRNLPQIFMDPEHISTPLGQQVLKYFTTILQCNRVFLLYSVWMVLIIAGSSVLLRVDCFQIKDQLAPIVSVGLIISCALCMLVQLDFMYEKPYINYIMFPINMIAPYCVIHSRKRIIGSLFWWIWAPGFIYTFCIFLASNQEFYAISSASTVMTVASIMILVAFVCEIKNVALNTMTSNKGNRLIQPSHNAKITLTIVSLLLVLQLVFQLYLRYSSVFWEADGMKAQSVIAVSGPERGIIMTQSRLDNYNKTEQDVDVILKDTRIKSVLFLSKNTIPYLSAQKEIASFSAWLSNVNDTSVSRLELYYRLHPNKIPDAIYVEAENKKYIEHFTWNGYQCRRLESGSYLIRKSL